MSLLNDNLKSQLILAGAEVGVSLFKNTFGISESANDIVGEKYDDDDLDTEELTRRLKEYEGQIQNVLSGADLGNKFKGTDTAFNSVIKIIMFNLEDDYREVISNFNRVIDNEEFIRSHEEALEKREKRLDREYEDELTKYRIALQEYEELEKNRNESGLLKRMLSRKEASPVKPVRRK